jgi:hypothetical protein
MTQDEDPEVLDHEAEIVRENVKRGGLRAYTAEWWRIADPTSTFRSNWHVDFLCEYLEAVSRGDVLNLVITLPPRNSKSIVTGVMWPSWHWATITPKFSWLYGSGDKLICIRDARRMNEVLSDPLHEAAYPEVRMPRVVAFTNMANTAGGSRFASTPDGKAVGHGSDAQVIDDPIKPGDKDSKSRHRLKLVIRWFSKTLASRINGEPEFFRRVIVMQRLHEMDLAGWALDHGFEHLCLPMRYDPHIYWDRGSSLSKKLKDPRTAPGELLDKRWTEASVTELENSLGGEASAQLQQNPIPQHGGYFDRNWFSKRWVTTSG